jgi:hypothetical protein
MARTPAKRRLKVFAAQFGFQDSVVAASSQKAALDAWGIRQNLFAEGTGQGHGGGSRRCRRGPGPSRHSVAPRRGVQGSFSLEPGLPDVPDPPRPKAPALKPVPKTAPPKPKRPPADRSALTAAEEQLAAINTRRIEDEAQFQKRREALQADEGAARQRWSRDRKAAEALLNKARTAFKADGGEA